MGMTYSLHTLLFTVSPQFGSHLKATRLIPGPPGPSPVLRVGGGRVRSDLVWQVVRVLYDTHTAR